MKHAERAEQLLAERPMTRHELELALGTSQQRVSEILRAVGAQVVGSKPPARQGRRAPIYGMQQAPVPTAPIGRVGRVSSVFNLARAQQ